MNAMKQSNIPALLLCLLMAGAVCYYQQTAAAVIAAGERCVTVIIPSLYLYSILSSLCVRTGLLRLLSKPLNAASRRFFHLEGSLLVVLLFSQIAGYPVGAQLLGSLQREGQITEKQKQELLCVCFGCGPAFLMGTLCTGLGLDVRIGWVLLFSVILPNLLGGILLARRCDYRISQGAEMPFRLEARHLTEAVDSGASAMWKICSMILCFGALMAILRESGIADAAASLAGFLPGMPRQLSEAGAALLEISCLPDFLRQGGSLPWAAALLSFGGICVHCQLAAICEGAFPWLRFWGWRLAASAASYWLCKGLLHFCRLGELSVSLADTGTCVPHAASQNIMAVWCLIFMSGMLLVRHDRLERDIAGVHRKIQKDNIDKQGKMRYNKNM